MNDKLKQVNELPAFKTIFTPEYLQEHKIGQETPEQTEKRIRDMIEEAMDSRR